MGRKNVWWVIIFTVVILACTLYMFLFSKKDNPKSADIYVGDELVKHIEDISSDELQWFRVETENGYNKVCWQNNEIWVEESDCKNQVCVHMKKISRGGETITCLPHHLSVTVEAERGVDFVQ